MESRRWKPLLVSVGLFLVILAVSGLMFALGGNWKRKVVFFPGLDGLKLSGEPRFLPRRGELDDRIRLLAEEAILGPADPTHRRYLPRELEVQSVIVRHGVAYVSVSRHLLKGTAEYHGTANDALQAMANTILYNFPRVRTLYLLVDGQLPHGAGEQGYVFSNKALR